MKKYIILSLLSTSYVMSGFFNETISTNNNVKEENKRLCKLYITKSHDYINNMRKDELASATLKHYKKSVAKYCGTIALKSTK